ncbi:hypothetical protein M011DRAFT_479470 [Sporormia fimetaria CBS 119925]|uniref:Oxo-4-hydroxy-4-carboxy-5-ureidoimidazoline decarboxylase domain-containing protein n=1 Tax=Sporormia fimetaria CBS 119925 TaxID=1340428 RepID=A0A6A6V3D8_9PLEO|nr:hypothetical protein M011DRAFT_479470 [Sporormia fimetaria CBS 119925]
MSQTLPPPSTLPTLPTPQQTHTLDLLFEPSPPLHTLILPLLLTQTFDSYPSLIEAIRSELLSLTKTDTTTLSSILCSHPRLGEKKVDSAQSAAEQKQLQGDGEEAEMLRALNKEYEERFPGLRYVVFVNGRPRPVIMQNMRERIARGDIEAERLEAIHAMCDIALDRAGKLQKSKM